jgi:hypothetical protein
VIRLDVPDDHAARKQDRIGEQISIRAHLRLRQQSGLIRRKEKRSTAGIFDANIAAAHDRGADQLDAVAGVDNEILDLRADVERLRGIRRCLYFSRRRTLARAGCIDDEHQEER